MADITMCTNEKCTKRFTCYRFMAIPSGRQAVFYPPPQEKDCEYYWKIDNAS